MRRLRAVNGIRIAPRTDGSVDLIGPPAAPSRAVWIRRAFAEHEPVLSNRETRLTVAAAEVTEVARALAAVLDTATPAVKRDTGQTIDAIERGRRPTDPPTHILLRVLTSVFGRPGLTYSVLAARCDLTEAETRAAVRRLIELRLVADADLPVNGLGWLDLGPPREDRYAK